jgi:predicted dehydrogenase
MVRLGFVGTGGRATAEMRELATMPDVTLAAFCDIVPEKCAAALDLVNASLVQAGTPPIRVPFFKEAGEMLAAVELDGVYVSLPPFVHGPIEHAILDARRALFVEKPIGLDMTVTREIEAHAREAGVVTCVGYQLRYSPAIDRARELLAGRPIGMAVATRFGGVPPTPWWRVQRQSGGMLIEQHTHGVDLLRCLVGEVESVYAQADTRLLTDMAGLDIADVNAATLRFASGAVGLVGNSCALVGGLRALGLAATAILAKGLILQLGGREATANFEGGRTEALPSGGNANRRLNEAFVHALRTGDRSRIRSDYSDGLRSFEVTYACHLSATRNAPVRIGQG